VPYWFIVTRSFRIAWDHKYLWLLAVFAGEGGGGGFSYSQGYSGSGSRNRFPNFANTQHQVTTWLSEHAGLVVGVALVWVLLVIALFVLAAACEGALVRGSAEHDAERPFNLSSAWQSGLATLGLIIRFRLLLIALALPAVIVTFVLVFGFVWAILNNAVAVAVILGIVGFFVLLLVFVYAIYLSFLDRLGTRAAVLEQIGAWAAVVRGHRLLLARLGRVLLVWLLSIAVGFGVGIAAGVVAGIAGIPLIVGAVALFAGGPGAWWILVAIGLVIEIPVVLVLAGFLGAQSSTYWTLAFRRLEIDQA
jgi:hypothetical protein